MNLSEEKYNYEDLKNKGTGSHKKDEDYKIIIYPFDKYEVKIKLTPTNEFVEIEEIKINRDFLSFKQKITKKGFHDVDKFYKK